MKDDKHPGAYSLIEIDELDSGWREERLQAILQAKDAQKQKRTEWAYRQMNLLGQAA